MKKILVLFFAINILILTACSDGNSINSDDYKKDVSKSKSEKIECPDGYTLIDNKCYIIKNEEYSCRHNGEYNNTEHMCYTEMTPACPVVEGINIWLSEEKRCSGDTTPICGVVGYDEKLGMCAGYYEPYCEASMYMKWKDGNYVCVRQWDFSKNKDVNPG